MMNPGIVNVVLLVGVWFVMLVWYVRPIYNFMAKRKYGLLDLTSLSLTKRIQTWLPSLLFYTVIFGLVFYPAVTNDLLGLAETSSIMFAQIVFLFLFSRYDKWQTKYQVLDDGLQFRKKYIAWDDAYTVQFKRSAFFILHKPRFIIKSEKHVIVVPMLSHNIERFIRRLSYKNQTLGTYAKDLYEHTKAYYVTNIEIEKELNKLGK